MVHPLAQAFMRWTRSTVGRSLRVWGGGFEDEAEVVDTAAWVETANMTDQCDLRELGGFDTTYVNGERVISGVVIGPTWPFTTWSAKGSVK